jgi:hypothetical protein
MYTSVIPLLAADPSHAWCNALSFNGKGGSAARGGAHVF